MKEGNFPVKFVQIEGFNDETDACIQHLTSLTHLVYQMFETLAQNQGFDDFLLNLVKDLLLNMGPRGILIMLGHRKTAGSQDISWPTISELKESFNRPHTVLTEEQKAAQPRKIKVS